MTEAEGTMVVWLVEHYVEWGSTTVLGLYKERGDARDAALAAAQKHAGQHYGEPTIKYNFETGAVTYSVRNRHFTAMPIDVK